MHSIWFGGGEQRFLIVTAGEQTAEYVAVFLELNLGRLLVDHEKAMPERILAERRMVEHGVQVLLEKPALFVILFVVEQIGEKCVAIEELLLRAQVDIVEFRFVGQRCNDETIARVCWVIERRKEMRKRLEHRN